MKSSKFMKYGLLTALCILVGHIDSQAADRNVPDASSAIEANLNNFKVTVPDSPACDGSSASGGNWFTNSYYYDGVRGRAYDIEAEYFAYVSGEISNADWAIGSINFPDGTSIQYDRAYNDYVDTNNPCNLLGDQFSVFGGTVNGQDRLDLVYQTDKIWNQGLYAFVTGAIVDTNWDDAGDINFYGQDGLPVTTIAPAEDGTTVTVFAKVSNPWAFPTNTLVYEIDGSTDDENDETLGCTITTSNGWGVITVTNIPGTLTVRAYCTDEPDCWIEADLQVGCPKCSGGSDCTGDGSGPGVNSVRVDINAGATQFGKSAGYFRIDQPYPSTALATPVDLHYYSGGLTSNDVVVVRSNGIVQQVFAPQISANVVSNSPYQYQILFYTNTSLSGTTYTTWTFLNPDGAGASNRLTVTKLNQGVTTEFDYTWNPILNGWSMSSEGGAKVEARYNTTNGVIRTESHLIYDGSSTLKFQETNIYQTFPWGQRLVQHTLGGGSNALTTMWTYYTNSSDVNDYGYLYQVVSPGNHWERYAYQSPGLLVRKVTQYLDAPIPSTTAQENTNRVTTYTNYTDANGFPAQAATNFLNNQVLSWVNRQFDDEQVIETECQTPDPAYGPNFWLVTHTTLNETAPFIGQPLTILRPDGTMSFYSYSVSADGNFTTNTVSTGQPDSNQTKIIDGTTTITVLSKAGTQLSQQTFDVASGLLTSSRTTLGIDTQGRPTLVQYLDGTTETTVYGCCGIESFTDRQGVTTTYNYDPYTKRVTDATALGIRMHTDYDAAGSTVDTIRFGTDNSPMTLNVSSYDTAGRLISSTPGDNGSGMNQTTTYSEYFDGNNHRIDSTTNPDGGTRIETHYQDGSLLSVNGTATFPLQYSYGMSTTSSQYGEFTTTVKLGSSGQTNEWTSVYQNSLGRNFLTIYAGPTNNPTSQSFYNTIGQLIFQIDQDGVTTLYQYNAKGQLLCTATDMNGDRVITFGGTDLITETLSDVANDNGVTVNRTRTFVWNVENSASSNLVSTAEISADGLQSWSIIYNNGIGVTNHSQTTYNPSQGYRILTDTAPDGSQTVNVNQFGRLISVTQKDPSGQQIGQTTYGYDAHGRQNTQTDARNGTSTSFFNGRDQVAGTLSPSPDGLQSGQTTSNLFDGVGRIWKSILPDATCVTNVYYTNSLLKQTYGSRTYPVQYTYDVQGRTLTMTTWTNFAVGGGAAVTTWSYDGYRGFMTNKAYADGNGPGYTYTAAGRLASRLWERTFTVRKITSRIITSFAYDPAGEMISAIYNDSSPTNSYVYDRLGRQTTITNGSTVCTLLYDDVGDLISESYSGGPLNGLSITNAYDSLLRRTALALASQPATLTQFGYDAASRLQAVTNGTASAVYSYLANSPLVGQVAFAQSGTTRMTTTKQYDFLNRLTSISSAPSASSAVSFSYANNSANQRSSVTNADNSYWVYQYDNLGQVTSGRKYWADGTAVSGQQFTYNFDDIGNRKTNAFGGDQNGSNLRSATYTNNSLNQITGRTIPGYITVIGSANSNATVTVNLQRALRHGGYFSDELVVTNTSAAIWQPFTNVAVLNNGTNADIITTNQGNGLLTKTPEAFTYDADGNLLSDGRFTYAWDDENRLTNITSQSGIPNAAKMNLAFIYDYMGRRIQKIFSSNSVPQYTNKYVYDGWNLIAELGTNNALVRSYMWGTDLSGSMNGAGGVGGLLEMNYYGSVTTNAFASYDGNGNVAGLVNAADGTTLASYEYGPFGEVLRANGSMAKANPWRFSTKYQDETELLYYGYRYYNPSDGRWLNRDPLFEKTIGTNVYAVGFNDFINGIDLIGLEWKIYQDESKARADVVPGDGDTIQTLADQLHLSTFGWEKWLLSPTGDSLEDSEYTLDTPIPKCARFSVPNTVYVDIGIRLQPPQASDSFIDKVGLWFWTSEDHTLGHGPWSVETSALISVAALKELKFHTVLTEGASSHVVKAHLAATDIIGYIFAGHGEKGNINSSQVDEMVQAQAYTQYGIRYMQLLACDTGTSGGLPYWIQNVAKTGTFIGYNGLLNLFDENKIKVTSPGSVP